MTWPPHFQLSRQGSPFFPFWPQLWFRTGSNLDWTHRGPDPCWTWSRFGFDSMENFWQTYSSGSSKFYLNRTSATLITLTLLANPSEDVVEKTVWRADRARSIINLPHIALLVFRVQWSPLVLSLQYRPSPVQRSLLVHNLLATVSLQLVRTSMEHLVLQELSFEAEHLETIPAGLMWRTKMPMMLLPSLMARFYCIPVETRKRIQPWRWCMRLWPSFHLFEVSNMVSFVCCGIMSKWLQWWLKIMSACLFGWAHICVHQ